MASAFKICQRLNGSDMRYNKLEQPHIPYGVRPQECTNDFQS